MKTVYSVIFSLLWISLPLSLVAQNFHLVLQDIHHTSLVGDNPPRLFKADHLQGEVWFEISYENDCKEKYKVIWTFLQDMSKLNIQSGRTRDLNYVSLIVPQSKTCPSSKKSKASNYEVKVSTKKLSPKQLAQFGLKQSTINEGVSFKALVSKKKTRIKKKNIKGLSNPFQVTTNELNAMQFCYFRLVISGPTGDGIARGFEEEVIYVYQIKNGSIIEDKLPPPVWTPHRKKKSRN